MDKKKKARQFVDKIYQAAVNYKNKHGYRENLGYDQQNNLEEFMNEIDLPYGDAAEIIDYFYMKMEQI